MTRNLHYNRRTPRTAVAFAMIALAACSGGSAVDKSTTTQTTSGDVAGARTDTATATAGTSAASPAPAAMDDKTIVTTLYAVDKGEVEAGRLAQTKATNPRVKAFANEMVKDHGQMEQGDTQLAKALSVPVTAPPGGEATPAGTSSQLVQQHQHDMKQLQSTKKGPDFDRAYIDAQVTGHQQVLQTLQSARSQTQNADLKAAIDAAIPHVQDHLKKAQSIQQALTGGPVNGATRGDTATGGTPAPTKSPR